MTWVETAEGRFGRVEPLKLKLKPQKRLLPGLIPGVNYACFGAKYLSVTGV